MKKVTVQGRWVYRGIAAALLITIGAVLAWPRSGIAYTQYTQNGHDGTNCGSCHGDFRSTSYMSLVDGQNWGHLHNLHRITMLNSDCATCHGKDFLPVMLDVSDGGSGLSPIGCVGCHGRAQDNVAGNPEVGAGRSGYGAAPFTRAPYKVTIDGSRLLSTRTCHPALPTQRRRACAHLLKSCIFCAA